MGLLALCALLALASPARAGGPEIWAALNDARLAEAEDRDPGAAIAIYETVLHHLPDDDPLYGELLLQLARARFDQDDLVGARKALTDASEDPQVGARARAWLVQLGAYSARVQGLPLETSFEAGSTPFVLGWSAAPEASLQTGDRGLVWTNLVRDGRDDYLLAAIDEEAGPVRGVRLAVEATELTAHMRLILEDDGGRRWTAPVVQVPPGRITELSLATSELLPAQGSGLDLADPSRIRVIMLQDVTAFHSTERGLDHLVLHRLELR